MKQSSPIPLHSASTSKPTKLRLEHLVTVEPITDNQAKAFDFFKKDYHLILSGSAGSGKTFLSMYLGLDAVLRKETPYDKVIIVRSVVPTRDIGFLPGTQEEKERAYILPYIAIVDELFNDKNAYDKLSAQGSLQFITTSYIRGVTLRNAIIVVDEMQNMSWHELSSVITRIGDNCKIIFSGDYNQSDLSSVKERQGLLKFLEVLDEMVKFRKVEFGWQDIVRSSIVKDFIITCEMKKITL